MAVKRLHELRIEHYLGHQLSVNGEITNKQLPANDVGSNKLL
jgi:hypothetical protein